MFSRYTSSHNNPSSLWFPWLIFSFIFLNSSANLVVYHLSMPLATPCPTILLLVEVRVSHDLYVNCLIIILYSLMFAYIKKSFYFRASQTYFFSCHIMSKVCHSYVLSPDHSIMETVTIRCGVTTLTNNL
jgi:hypothetical protein